MLTRWQSREIGEKTKTVTYVVNARQLASRHWQLVLESQNVTAVHVNLNRLADKENYKCCLMRHVPGTYIWVRTIPITPTYRGASSFQLDPDDDKAIEQPPHTRGGQQVRAASPDHANVSDISMHNTLDIDEKAAAPNLLQVPMALKAREIPHELHLYDGGHDWRWWRAAF